MTTEKPEIPEKQNKITPFSFMGSIIAAWFGVQTKTNRERDFEHGSFTTLFLAVLSLPSYLYYLLSVL